MDITADVPLDKFFVYLNLYHTELLNLSQSGIVLLGNDY